MTSPHSCRDRGAGQSHLAREKAPSPRPRRRTAVVLMPWWAWLLTGLFIGAAVGYFAAVLMISASMRDSM